MSRLNGLLPFVLVVAGRLRLIWKLSNNIGPVSRPGAEKFAPLKLPLPPTVDTFVGVTVRSVVAVPVIAPKPVAVPKTPSRS